MLMPALNLTPGLGLGIVKPPGPQGLQPPGEDAAVGSAVQGWYLAAYAGLGAKREAQGICGRLCPFSPCSGGLLLSVEHRAAPPPVSQAEQLMVSGLKQGGEPPPYMLHPHLRILCSYLFEGNAILGQDPGLSL